MNTEPSRRPQRHRVLVITSGVLVLAIAAAACGGKPARPTAGAAPASTAAGLATTATPARPGARPARLLSYQTSYDALGAECDPSYTLRAGTGGETGFIRSYVSSGYTVVMADYEGEDAAYGVGQLSGYETLDAIRAAENWLGVPEAAMPVLAYIDEPGSAWTGQIPAYLDGLARGFGARDLSRYSTQPGIAAANADQTRCSGTFTGLPSAQLFKPRYQDIAKIPVLARILDDLIMSRSGTPRGPLFIGNGLSDSAGDGVTVTRDVQELAYIYCQRGVPVELRIYHGLDHDQAGTPFFAQAQTFLAQRFAKQPFRTGCAQIGPGDSIAPVTVPVP